MYVNELPNCGYSFRQKTFYSDHHLGQDKLTKLTPLQFPVDLINCTYLNGKQGGLTVAGYDSKGYLHRFMHNSEFKTTEKIIKAGTVFAISGSTGAYSTSDHSHWDIRFPKKTELKIENFIDPLIWVKDILPNLKSMSEPQWVQDTLDKAKTKGIDVDNSPFTPLQTAWILEASRKYIIS
jgi:hypothetical protein